MTRIYVSMYISIYLSAPTFVSLTLSLSLSLDVTLSSPSTSVVWSPKNMKFGLCLPHLGNISWLSIALRFLSFTSGGDQIPWGRKSKGKWRTGWENVCVCVFVCLLVSRCVYLHMFISGGSTLGLLLSSKSHPGRNSCLIVCVWIRRGNLFIIFIW